MKKINILLPILLLGLLISCQTDWITKTENTIEKSEKKFKLIKQIDTIENSQLEIKIQLFKTGNISKIEINSKFSEFGFLIDLNQEFYKNDTIIISEKIYGLSPLIYKRERKNDEPPSELIEKISYFKNKKNGIQKIRTISFYQNDNIEIKRKELQELEFEIKDIGEKEYSNIKNQYDRYNKY